MRRLRFLRVLLPLLLLLLVVVLVRSWQVRPTAHPLLPPPDTAGEEIQRIEDARLIDLIGPDENLSAQADVVRHAPDGRLVLDGIERLEINRPGRGPLLVSAAHGVGVGAVGERIWDFDQGVVLRDPAKGLELRLPLVEVDESQGIAVAEGDIRFSGPGQRGRATRLVYGFEGQPGELTGPRIEDESGANLSAAHAALLDGLRDVEFSGDVRVERPEQRLDAQRLRLIRDDDDRPRRMTARGEVAGAWSPVLGPSATLDARDLEVEWDGAGAIGRVDLSGDVVLGRGEERLSCTRLAAVPHPGGDGGWDLDASGEIRLRAAFESGTGLLRGDRLEASFGPSWQIRRGRAEGNVSYEADRTRAEAEVATLSRVGAATTIELLGAPPRKARLARDRTRVAAERIVTDPRGERLTAVRAVEATLLGETGRAVSGLFRVGEAVHFIADRLDGQDGGARLEFNGAVRGWQGERNLAAGQVIVEQATRRLVARHNVATRIPRRREGAASESDFLQIGADGLVFEDDAGLAVFEGRVRMTLVEGWLEAERLEVELVPDSREIREVRAYRDVRLEFTDPADATAAPIAGQADRAVYDPPGATLRLFGDQAPARLRLVSEGGATTTGSVLLYRTDLGTLEVDSGARGPAKIRTGPKEGTQ